MCIETVFVCCYKHLTDFKNVNNVQIFVLYPLTWHLLRGQRTLAWAWPDQTLLGQELTDRQAQLPATGAPGQRVALVSECPGEPGRPYCKRLVLTAAQGAKDTGYYRCYYKDVKAIIVGTTAASIYVFVRGESQNPQTPPAPPTHPHSADVHSLENENTQWLAHLTASAQNIQSASLISFNVSVWCV